MRHLGKLWLTALGFAIFVQAQSLEKERALGEGILRQTPRFENAEVAAYVERVGARLGSGFRFVVVAGDLQEPAGLPGNLVMVPARFLLAVEDEAEFAGMVAHAMGHAALRHGLTAGTSEGSVPVIYMGGWMGAHGDPALYPMAMRGKLAAWELEADRYAVAACLRAGYDGAGLGRYLRRTRAAEERVAALGDSVAAGGEVLGSEFLRVREMVGSSFRPRLKG